MNVTEHSPPKLPSRGIFTVIAVAALPVLNFFLFGTFNLYAGNPEDFDSGFRDILPNFVPAMVISWVIFSGIGSVLHGPFRKRYVCLLFGFGLLMWAQGAFFAGDYGVLDGRGLDWHAFAWPAWLDIVLWIGVLAGFVTWYRHIVAIVLPATVGLILLQFVAVAHLGMTSEARLWETPKSDDNGPPEGIFRYSKDHNVVQLLLDNFQTDIFEELVYEEGLEDTLDGFVLFRENAAVAPYTTLAVPAIFRGRGLDATEPADTFFRRGMHEGFQNELHERGYTVNLSTMRPLTGSTYDNKYRVPNVYGATKRERIRKESDQLLDITLFRHVPHLARNWVYNENNWRLQRLLADPERLPASFAHKRFFRDYMERIEPRIDGRAYHFLHLLPPHPPYVTTAEGEYAGEVLLNTRENYKNEARHILLYVIDFLNTLKDLGIYDDTLIVLHSDHGGSFEPEFTPTRMLTMKAIKPRNSRGTLRISDAQVSLADIAATILREEGLDVEWSGRSVFDVNEHEVRERWFGFYHGDRNQYLRLVRIGGSLYMPESYTYLDSTELGMALETYTYGEETHVGLRGTGSPYLDKGWSMPSPGVAWNNGHEATLRIPIESPQGDLRLTLGLFPFIARDAPRARQRIGVYVDDERLGAWELEGRAGVGLETTIPVELVTADELVIRFDLPDAVRPRNSPDQRLLAIGLRYFKLEEL